MNAISLKLLTFGTIVLLLCSCETTRTVTKLLPHDEADKWRSGQALLTDSIYGVSYEIGFDRIADGYYWFDFSIYNRSNMPLLVDPISFQCQFFDGTMTPKTQDPVAAIDPEQKLQEFESEIAHNQRTMNNQFGNFLLGIGASVAANAIIGDNPKNDVVRFAVTDAIMTTAATSGERASYEILNLNEMQDLWTRETIRKTTLDTNYSIHGKVFFRYKPDATYVQLTIPVDDKTLLFNFNQIRFELN